MSLSQITITDRVQGQRLAREGGHFVVNVADPEENCVADVFVPLVCLFNSQSSEVRSESFRIPTDRLRVAAAAIDVGLDTGQPVVVHCTAGLERSPLAVAWWYATRYGVRLPEAYEHVKRIRPEALDRSGWVGYADYAERQQYA